jgi:N-acetylglucosaminyldiphosphoundecaprenol N-acetyl-beta-D-mannosaminyltransferase
VVSLCEIASKRGASVYLLGSGPGVAEQAAAMLQYRLPALSIAGAEMGHAPGTRLSEEEERALVERIRASHAAVLFVAFGAPLQETWLSRNKAALGVPIAVGVGGAFDVLSGRIPRAPRIMRRFGLEWLFRLVRMPWRWRRQFTRLPRFIGLVLLQALRGSSDRDPDSLSPAP